MEKGIKQKIRIGCGAGFSGDRLEPAIVLAEKGELDYLVLECLAERTIALAQKRKLADPSQGYDPMLMRRVEGLLPLLLKNEITLITNMGAANPLAAAEKIHEYCQQTDQPLKIAAVYGDDLIEDIQNQTINLQVFGQEKGLNEIVHSPKMLSANAYVGIEGILMALEKGAQVIITGRVADPSLFLAPMVHAFQWALDDFELLGKGTVTGHLLECAGQICGGYFADPLKKEVPDMENLGHPFADVYADGRSVISKVKGTGGCINLATAKEQLLYEVVDPSAYYTPDVIADFTSVHLTEMGSDQIAVSGGGGTGRPATFKVSVGYKAFWLGEGEITYKGSGALRRAQLAADIVRKRISGQYEDFHIDFLGQNHLSANNQNSEEPAEVRLRIAAKAQSQTMAALVGEEVEALYTNGPAGGGGVRKYVNEIIGITSALVDRSIVAAKVKFWE